MTVMEIKTENTSTCNVTVRCLLQLKTTHLATLWLSRMNRVCQFQKNV